MTCSFCDSELEERLVQHEYRWEGNLFVFEDVPARVCRQCGEKYEDDTFRLSPELNDLVIVVYGHSTYDVFHSWQVSLRRAL